MAQRGSCKFYFYGHKRAELSHSEISLLCMADGGCCGEDLSCSAISWFPVRTRWPCGCAFSLNKSQRVLVLKTYLIINHAVWLNTLIWTLLDFAETLTSLCNSFAECYKNYCLVQNAHSSCQRLDSCERSPEMNQMHACNEIHVCNQRTD